MTLTVEQIKAAALQLDPAQREALAEELLQSVTESQARAIDESWLKEVYRRDSGRSDKPTQGHSVDQVVGRLLKKG